VLVASFANHQHQVMRLRLHVENFDRNFFLTPDDEHFAGTVPAYLDCNLRPLPEARSAHNYARTHAGEVPTQILLGRHTFPSNYLRVAVMRGRGRQKQSRPAPCHSHSHAIAD